MAEYDDEYDNEYNDDSYGEYNDVDEIMLTIGEDNKIIFANEDERNKVFSNYTNIDDTVNNHDSNVKMKDNINNYDYVHNDIQTLNEQQKMIEELIKSKISYTRPMPIIKRHNIIIECR